jgi:hypothetical protein
LAVSLWAHLAFWLLFLPQSESAAFVPSQPARGWAIDWDEIPAQPKVAGRPCDDRHVQVSADQSAISRNGTP